MALRSGDRLGVYEIIRVIGAGGMGEVLRARDTKLGREVAIKVLPEAVAEDPERLVRFEREARTLASLNHPNIAQVYGFESGPAAAVNYIVMELVEGEDLATRLLRGRLSIPEAVGIARQVAEGLEEAHGHGVVHRDLKPANVVVAVSGRAKVLDFGIAKILHADREDHPWGALPRTRTLGTVEGQLIGTVAYMSPEQARGKPVDRRTDVWSFGVLLYEMLTGSHLFGGETESDTLAAVLMGEPAWSALPPATPASLVELLKRCLDRDLATRLQSIGEARLLLAQAAAGEAGSVPEPARAADRGSGRRGIASIALGAAVVAGIGIGLLLARSQGERAPAALTVTPLTSSGNVIAAALSPDGRYLAYVESEQGVQGLWLKQIASGQTLRLTPDQNVNYWGLAFAPDGSRVIFALKSREDTRGSFYSVSTLGGAPRLLLRDIDSTPAFSPDGRRFAYTRNEHPTPQESALMIASADGSNPTVLASFKRPHHVAGLFFTAPAWSPDGTTIVVSVGEDGHLAANARGRPSARARLVRVGVEGGAVTPLVDAGWVDASAAVFRPDGETLLVIARAPDQTQPQIWSVSFPGGEAKRVTTDLNDHRIVSLSQDGKSLVSVSGLVSSALWTQSLDGAKDATRIAGSPTDGLNGLAFTREGKLLFTSYAGDVWSLWISELDGSARRPLLSGSPGEMIAAPLVADDGTVYYISRRGSASEIRSTSADGSSSRTVVHDAPFDTFGITPAGARFLLTRYSAGAPRLSSMPADGSSAAQLFEGPAYLPAVDAAGKRVVFNFFDEQKRFRLGVRAIDGGPLLMDIAAETLWAYSRLALNDDGVLLNTMPGDRANVWLLPFSGAAPRRLTSFEDRQLFDFALSRDGKTLALARGPRVRDAQMITGF
jgi:Tol biopolymer transport system component